MEKDNRTDYALLLRKDDLSSMGRVRKLRDASVILDGDKLWLIVRNAGKAELSVLRPLPAWKRYIIKGKLLYPEGKTVPFDKLPSSREMTLSEFIEVSRPQAQQSFYQPEKIKLSLKRTSRPAESSAVIVNAAQFLSYCESCLEVRLKNLKYLIKGDSLLVTGKPLPSILGKHYYTFKRLYLPAGFCLKEQVDEYLLEYLLPGTERWMWESPEKEPVQLPAMQKVSLSSLRRTMAGDRYE